MENEKQNIAALDEAGLVELILNLRAERDTRYRQIYEELGRPNMEATHAWFDRWQARTGILVGYLVRDPAGVVYKLTDVRAELRNDGSVACRFMGKRRYKNGKYTKYAQDIDVDSDKDLRGLGPA